MKHRILEFLSGSPGFGAFAMEANWPEAEHLDDFIRTGEGEPEALLRALHFWTWRTEEVRDLVLWMRQEHSSGRPLRFTGFDVQFPHAAISRVIAYLETRDADIAERSRAAYQRLTEHWPALDPHAPDRKAELARGVDSFRRYQALSTGRRNAGKQAAAEPHRLLASLNDQSREHAEALRAAWVVVRAERSQRFAAEWMGRDDRGLARLSSIARIVWMSRFGRRDVHGRDEAMAEMVDWLRGDSRMVLWAHNGHVMNRRPLMGWHLRKRYGRDYVAVGFATSGGSFRARKASHGGPLEAGDPVVHSLTAIAPGGLDDALARVSPDRFFVDIRTAPDGAVKRWLRGRRTMLNVGAVFGEQHATMATNFPTVPARDWDILFYLRETTASRPL